MTYPEIVNAFEAHANPEIAAKQKAYLKDKFEFYGIKSPQRREIQRPFLLKSNLPDKENAQKTIQNSAYKSDKRELHYLSIEWFIKYKKEYEKEDIHFIEYLITTNSWWDSVDSISSNICGPYFLKFVEERKNILPTWIRSKNMWLNRSAMLFQLKYKDKTDTTWLAKSIEPHFSSKEFFLQKATGWILREYAKTNPNWVKNYLIKNQHKMANLSVREATKHISLD